MPGCCRLSCAQRGAPAVRSTTPGGVASFLIKLQI
jgi:hypothetical protein